MKLKDLEKRLKHEPSNLGLRVQVAGMMREAGRSLEAVEIYRSVALAYRDQGRTQQAIAVCRSILEIAPEDSACQGLLAMLQARSAPAKTPPETTSSTPGAEEKLPRPGTATMRNSSMPPAPEVPSLRPATAPVDGAFVGTSPRRSGQTGRHRPVMQTGPQRPVAQTGPQRPVGQTGQHRPVAETSPTGQVRAAPALPVAQHRPAPASQPQRQMPLTSSPPLRQASPTAPPQRSGPPTAPPQRSGPPTAPPQRSGPPTAPPQRSGPPTAPPQRSGPPTAPPQRQAPPVSPTRAITRQVPQHDPRAIEPGRRSSFDHTPLPAPMPYHAADRSSQASGMSAVDIENDDLTRVDPSPTGLAHAARRISGLISDPRSDADLAAELDTRQRPRIDPLDIDKVAAPPPTVPVPLERLDELDDMTTPPPASIEDLMADRMSDRLSPSPRSSDETIARPSRPSMPKLSPPRTSSRPPAVVSIPPKTSSRPPGAFTDAPAARRPTPSVPPPGQRPRPTVPPPAGSPVSKLRPQAGNSAPPVRPAMSKIQRDSESELTRPRDRGGPDDDDD